MCNMCTRDVIETGPAPVAPVPKPSRTLERMKKKHNIVTDPSNSEKQKEVEYQPDLLAVSTKYSKVAYDLFKQGLVRLQESKAYVNFLYTGQMLIQVPIQDWNQGLKLFQLQRGYRQGDVISPKLLTTAPEDFKLLDCIATRTSQPFHVALAVMVLLAWLSRPGSSSNIRGWRALYVAAVATHLGTQIWMTLISGIVLYFNLPRHEFGRVQTVLFPVYYAFNAVISLLALLAYYKTQCLTQFEHTSWIQLALLLAVFSIESYVRLRLVSPMLRAKHVKTQMEEAAGGGQEVGRLILGELAHCPRYLRVLKTFRTYHSSIAMGTMIALGCSLYSTMIIVDSMCR